MRSYIVRVYGGPSLSGTVQQVADAGGGGLPARRAAAVANAATAGRPFDTGTTLGPAAAADPNAVQGFGSGEELLQRLKAGDRTRRKR